MLYTKLNLYSDFYIFCEVYIFTCIKKLILYMNHVIHLTNCTGNIVFSSRIKIFNNNHFAAIIINVILLCNINLLCFTINYIHFIMLVMYVSTIINVFVKKNILLCNVIVSN